MSNSNFFFGPLLLLLMQLLITSQAGRRNLSEITHRFTTCGSSSYRGPEVLSQCLPRYQTVNSPIVANEERFFEFDERFYEGAQGFRVPRNDLYNVTIAGAAGGKGVCNHEFGKGGVVNIQVRLTTDYEYLILVGQKGASVCDKSPNHVFCTVYVPPTNVEEALVCNESWYNWTSSLPENNLLNLHYRYNGGGGGGGASMVWPKRIADKVFTDSPLAIGAGGGGTSAILDYSYLADILSRYDLSYPGDSDNTTIYRYHVNAHTQRYLLWPLGARGTRPQSTGGIIVITSGSGGGWTPYIALPLIDVDGKLLSQKNGFAGGGFDCVSRIFSQQDRYIFRAVFGGYGGGGGGCGSGGAGGGYTGGHIFTNKQNIPGGGGDIGVFPVQNPDFPYNGSTFHLNSGDGYVEIVSSNCTCTGWCVVYSEENEFECFCPNETTLAGDGSSCYKESNITVDVRESQRIEIDRELYFVHELEFSNTSVSILSLDVQLSVKTHQDNPLPEDGVSCVVVFIGSDSLSVLASNPVKVGEGKANLLTRLVGLPVNYSRVLDSPVLVIGALLLTNGKCSLIDPFQMTLNTSTVETAISSLSHFSNSSLVSLSVRSILGIRSDQDNDEVTKAVITGTVPGTLLLFVVVSVVCILLIWKVKKTKNKQQVEQSVRFEHTYEIPGLCRPPLPVRNISSHNMLPDETSQSQWCPGQKISLEENQAYTYTQGNLSSGGEPFDRVNETDLDSRECQTEDELFDLSTSLCSNPVYDNCDVVTPVYANPNPPKLNMYTNPNTNLDSNEGRDSMVENPLYASGRSYT